MKAMSKSELADRAGVSVNTLMNWCRPFNGKDFPLLLFRDGIQDVVDINPKNLLNIKNVVNDLNTNRIIRKFLAEKFCIDLPEP